jgi:hypothetical protein
VGVIRAVLQDLREFLPEYIFHPNNGWKFFFQNSTWNSSGRAAICLITRT